MRIRATSILGLEPAFLEVLDERLREALKAARVRELDALVLAAAGSSDPLANQAVARLARLWGTHHKLPVTAAYASAAPPATGEAVRAFRAEGRRHIAVASLFLAPGFLPDRAAELALEAGAVAVSEPARRPPQAGPRRPGPVRRRRRRARPRLKHRPVTDCRRVALSRQRVSDGSTTQPTSCSRSRSSWRAGSEVTPPWTGPGWNRTTPRFGTSVVNG